MGRLWPPLSFAFRSLRRRPAFAAACAAVLSLGIAAVTTIFGVTSGVLFRPLPYKEPDRLAFVLGSEPPGSDVLPLSPTEFALVRDEARSFTSFAAVTEDVALLGTGRDARSHRGIRASSRLAETLGVSLRLGRLPDPGDESAGADPVVVGEALWLRELGADHAVVGRTIVLDGEPVRVAGVLAPGARLKPILGFEPAWWRFLSESEASGSLPRGRRLIGIGRLSDASSLESAEAEAELLASRLASSGAKPGRTVRVAPVRDTIDPGAYALVALLLASILGIVCLNVGALLLARALARGREVAVRLALGAGRRDVFGQLVAEGILVGLLGGVLGLALTFGAVGLVRDLATGTNAEAVVFEVDAWVWAAAAATSLLAGVLAGLVPAFYWMRQEPESILKEGAHGATPAPGSRRLRNLLVASEVALSMALLSQAGLAVQSLRGLLAADRGFEAGRVLTVRLSFPPAGSAAAAREVLERVRGLPGVRDAAFATALPAGAPMQPYRTVGGRAESGQARVAGVSPGYFGTLGIALRAGRDFTAGDASGAAPVAIVNEELASRCGTGAAVLGAVVEVAGIPRTVVGVVETVRNPPLSLRSRPEVYVPWAPAGEAHLLADTALDRPLALAADLAAALRAVSLDEPPATVRSLESVLAANMGVIWLGTVLLALVALGAVAITVAGTYGVVTSLVVLRTREMGVRLALGAEPAGIRRLALEQGLRPVVAGLSVGVVAALALGRVLASRVYGLRPLEPTVLALAVLAFVAVVLPACYVPARRATRVDPAVTLRSE